MTDTIHVYFKTLSPVARRPTRGSERAAAFDLYMPHSGVLFPHETQRIDMGLALEIPPFHMGLILPRTSSGMRSITTIHPPYDEDFRGEISVILTNTGTNYFNWKEEDRLVQLVIVPVPPVVLVEVDELTPTKRGDGKFGSTGK